MTALSDALKQANDSRQLSVREIAELGGGRMSHSTVARYLNGQHPTNPDDEVLQALAKAFGLPIKRLRELAGQRAGESAPYKPPPEAHRLNARQRKAVDELIRSIVAGEQASVLDAEATPNLLHPDGPKKRARAATSYDEDAADAGPAESMGAGVPLRAAREPARGKKSARERLAEHVSDGEGSQVGSDDDDHGA